VLWFGSWIKVKLTFEREFRDLEALTLVLELFGYFIFGIGFSLFYFLPERT
jgi:hypothetical protein